MHICHHHCRSHHEQYPSMYTLHTSTPAKSRAHTGSDGPAKTKTSNIHWSRYPFRSFFFISLPIDIRLNCIFSAQRSCCFFFALPLPRSHCNESFITIQYMCMAWNHGCWWIWVLVLLLCRVYCETPSASNPSIAINNLTKRCNKKTIML